MSKPINIELMDVDRFIEDHQCKQVTTMFIKESTSNEFHAKGLFSEDIFGQIGSPERLIRFGYIHLNTTIFHPTIYGHLLRLKALYGEIISGRGYARFDTTEKDFITCGENDPGAGTGYKFFVDHFPKIVFKKNASITQNDKVDLINKYRDMCMIQNCIVMPAGLRDMSIDDGKPASDSINKLYASLINYTQAMPSIGSESDIFDGVRFAIQKKVNELYEFIFDMIEGKYGFFQRKYGSRNLALGTRNVITPADMSGASTHDPKFLRMDEIKLPLFEASKMYQPLVIYNLKQMFFADIFSQFADKVSLIDPKTLNLVYQPITEDEKTKFLSSEGLEKILSLFRDKEFRYTPVTVYNEDEQPFYLMMVYDRKNKIYFIRSVSAFIEQMKQANEPYDPSKLRPLTYAELIYVATFRATMDKHATVTRYPALEIGSDVPCRAHIMSSNPARTVVVISADGTTSYQFPEYPIIGNSFNDSAVLHPSILKGLDADFDGNCVVGSTTTKIRFTEKWIKAISESCYTTSKQDIASILTTLTQKTYLKDDLWQYAEIRMDEFPQPGNYTLDRNNAKVYTIPPGCFVESFDNCNCKQTYEPIEHITVEESCDTATINLRSKSVQVSTNESVAVFDHKTGNIIRIKPDDCSTTTYVPVYKKSDIPFGIQGSFTDGWLLGSLISDGWISGRYVGHTKLETATREFVKELLIAKTGCSHVTTNIVDDIDLAERYGKYGFSTTTRFAGKDVVDYVKSLNMYATDDYSFFTKQIPHEALVFGSEYYLWGILSGLLEGDGSFRFIDQNQTKLDARISTSSKYLVESVKYLCYRLGIRISVSTTMPRFANQHISYSIVLSSVDICQQIDNLQFAAPKYKIVKQYIVDFVRDNKRDQRDVIPITSEEGRMLRKALDLPYAPTAFYTPVVMRSIVLPLIPKLDPNCALVKRALNTNIHWESIRSVIPGNRESVYDFDIPTTRLYVVNNGVVTYDTVSVNGILTKEANEEVAKHLESVERFVHPNGSLYAKHTDLIDLTIFNLSRDPE